MATKSKATAKASGFTPGILETPELVYDLAFDASARFLVADDMVFQPGTPEPTPLGVKAGSLVPHPSRPLVAVLREDGVDLVELDGARGFTSLKVNEPSSGAFDSTGKLFVVSCFYSHQLRIFSLDGKLALTAVMPEEDQTAPAVLFGAGDASLLAFTDKQVMVTLPLDGKAPVVRSLPKVKVMGGSVRRAGAGRALFYDTAHDAMVTDDGKVLWARRAEKEGTALVPGTNAFAYLHLNKKLISFRSLEDSLELATAKVRVVSSPLGFACSGGVAAWTREGAIELVAVPALSGR